MPEWMSYFFHDMSWGQVCVLMISSVLIGINKSGIPGLGMLPIVFLAMAFQKDAGFSTGLPLVLLCAGDIFAVLYYRRRCNRRVILKLLPCALAGIGIGFLTLRFAGTGFLRQMIGMIILVMSAISVIRETWFKDSPVPSHPVFSITAGILSGFTTQVANAGGPVAVLYLMSMRMKKMEFVGTCAWYFMLMNWIKMPIFIFEGRITQRAIMADLPMIPLVLAGAFLGIYFVKRIPMKHLEIIVQVISILSAIRLLWPSDDGGGGETFPDGMPHETIENATRANGY